MQVAGHPWRKGRNQYAILPSTPIKRRPTPTPTRVSHPPPLPHPSLLRSPSSMGEQQPPPPPPPPPPCKPAGDHHHFKPSADVKGIRFGGQLVVRSFTVRRAGTLELLRLLAVPPSPSTTAAAAAAAGGQEGESAVPFPSATAYLPTSFTILAHRAWRTLTLGMGTRKSKVVIFVFESEAMKAAVEGLWPPVIPLGEVNQRLIRGLAGCEMARFKFRKGCLTFYVYAVRRAGAAGFWRAGDLRSLLEKVAALRDFLDHTAMLALPSQRSITFSPPPPPPVAVAH